MYSEKPQGAHRWKFFRVGGVEQVAFRDGTDIVHLPELDEKLWVALACPVKTAAFNNRTLELLDLDKDGRIRAPEVIAAVQWISRVYKDAGHLLKGGDSISLGIINDKTPEGAALLASARLVLQHLGRPEADHFSLADFSEYTRALDTNRFNGDGVVPPASAQDEETRRAIEEIIAAGGAETGRAGKVGITLASLEKFLAEARAWITWFDAGQDSRTLPIGENTGKAMAAMEAVRTKINDYFTRCKLAEFNPRAAAVLNPTDQEFSALAPKILTLNSEEIARIPLAAIAPGKPLPLGMGINPAWQAAIARFREDAVRPILNSSGDEISEEDWKALQARLAPYEAWMFAKPPTTVGKIGTDRLRAWVSTGIADSLRKLAAQDTAWLPVKSGLEALEKLLHIQRDFARFLRNFVSFADFYQRGEAIFLAGTLYVDSRSCDLCVQVSDVAKHAVLAGLARTYIVYCDCTRQGEKMTIAAAITAGDSDHLMVGRNGIFYDSAGRDWDATITRIIDNPISLWQAFWAPYKKFVRMVDEQIAKRAAAADTAAQAKLAAASTTVANVGANDAPPATPAVPVPKKVDVGTVAALGVALGSLTTFLGLVFAKFIDLGWWIPFALLGIVLAISGPSMLIAWLKLRQRNLGPILDASGWAVNGRMRINVPFGGALSKRAKLPPGSRVDTGDPFVESHKLRWTIIILAILLFLAGSAWKLGFLDRWLPSSLQHGPEKVILQPVTATTTNAPPVLP